MPEGLVLRKLAGSEDALRNLLLSLKKHKFTGYIQVLLSERFEEGYIIISEGKIAETFYFGSTKERGENASKKIWLLSKNPKSLIILHGQVEPEAVRKALLNFLEGKVEERKESEIEVRLRVLSSRGIDTSSIEKAIKERPDGEKKLVEIEELVRLEDEINNFLKDNPELTKKSPELVSELKEALARKESIERIREIYGRLRQRKEEKIGEELEARHLKELEEIIRRQREEEERKRRESAVYNLILQHKTQARDVGEPFCANCGSALAKDGQCLRCSLEKGYGRIVEKFSLTNFIVGSNNRFAYAVAQGVSKFPGKLYNPLFIYGPEGCGKTHLLNAIASNLATAMPGKKIIFTTVPILLASYEKYKENLNTLLSNLSEGEAIFIDEFEEIAGKDALQRLLSALLVKYVKEEKQVVVGSRLSPAEIPKLETELLMCFTNGMLVNISEPDAETKKEIMKKYCLERGVALETEIINYISRINLPINELTLVLNRIFALASINNQPIDIELVREALKEFTAKSPGMGRLRYNVQKGHSYLVEETRPEIIFQIASIMYEVGYHVLIFSRINPKRIVEKHEKLEGASIYWLTEKEGGESIGHSLEKIVYGVEEMLSKYSNTLVAIDGIEFLVSLHGFEAVVKFIRRIIDMIADSEGILLLSLGESTLKEQEIRILERELEVLKTD